MQTHFTIQKIIKISSKRKVYGSQISRDPKTQIYYVASLEDPDNDDKRRAKVRLAPLSDYTSRWQIKWDIEQYKKDLPKLEAIEKKR